MNKIGLIIKREYLTRIKKPSFWILTIVVPILIAALYAIPIILSTKSLETVNVMVVDETQLFADEFKSSSEIVYRKAGSLAYAQQQLDSNIASAIIHIPKRETTIPNDAFLYYKSKIPGINVQNDVRNQLQTILLGNILLDVHGITIEDYNNLRNTNIKLHTKDIETGREAHTTVKLVLGVALAMIVFITIFMFGSLVMRGVMEEKGNRVVEIIVSSVRPFQLMTGKIVGIACVGLTQFLLWMLLSIITIGGIQLGNSDLFKAAKEQQSVTEIATKGSDATEQMAQVQQMLDVPEEIKGLTSINFPLIASMFLFYFLLGYLLYAALFAAVGAVSDGETESNQFILPLTAPLLITFMLLPQFANAPSGALAQWLSIIPFTSPVAMLFRLPFGVPVWQVVLSALLLLATFPLCTWIAAKIYRRGILMYGKSFKWKDIFKLVKQH